MKRLPRLRRLRIRDSSGDTIVEVLIVLAVLSLAFSIAYATADHGLSQTRNAEEHSQALDMLDSQLELLRTAVNGGTTITQTTPFCMNGSTVTSFTAGTTIPSTIPTTSSANTLNPVAANYPAACQQNTFYNESIVYDGSNSTYDLRIRWDGIATLGPQQEELTYRVLPLSAQVSAGITLSASQLSIKVTAYAIPPAANNTTPSCGSAATSAAGNPSSVTLQQTSPAGPNQGPLSTTSSIALFQNLTDYDSYTATVTPPSGFGICSFGGSAALGHASLTSTALQVTPSMPNNPAPIAFKIYPICSTNSGVGSPYEHYATDYAWVHTGNDSGYAWYWFTGSPSSPPAVYEEYEWSTTLPNTVVLAGYFLQYTGGTDNNGQLYAYYQRWEYQPYTVDLGYYGDSYSYNTCPS